jgi:hypothetical protein
MRNRISKLGLALLGGVAVFASGMAVELALLGHDRRTVILSMVGNCTAGLVATIAGLTFQLNQEGYHFRFAMEKAVAIAELNHHVRNAVFPLFLAVQRSNDPESNRLASEAMSRIDIALRDASIDAYSGKINYGQEVPDSVAA